MNHIATPPTQVSLSDNEGFPGAWQQWFSILERLFNTMQGTGTTAQRPNPAPFIGYMYYDTTINRPIWASTLTTWRYSDGTAA